MVGGYVVDQLCSILKDIDADELPHFVTLDEDQDFVVDFLGPFYTPPELHVCAPATCCVKADVAPGDGARILAHKVAKWSLELQALVSKSFDDNVELLAKGLVYPLLLIA